MRRLGVRGGSTGDRRCASGSAASSSPAASVESRKQALEVDRAVFLHPDLGGQAGHGHTADANGMGRDGHGRVRDDDLRYLDPILVDAARAQGEPVQVDRGQRQVELGGRAQREPIPSAEVDRAAGQVVVQRVTEELTDPDRAQVRNRELAVRGDDGRQREAALPVELLVRLAAGGQAELAALGCRLEILQGERHRREPTLERPAARPVEKIDHAAVDDEVRNPDRGRFILFFFFDRRGSGRQVGEVHRAVRAYQGADVRRLHVDLAEIERALPERGQRRSRRRAA